MYNNMLVGDSLPNDVSTFSESVDGKKTGNVFIEGIFLQSDILNRNGRIYPLSAVQNAVHVYEQAFINTGRALGELGHPEGNQINLHLASHKIESLKMQGTNVIGRAKLLDTPMGNIAKSLVREGVKLGVSLRGYGSIRKEGDAVIVGDNFVLSTVDIVADPSAPDAFVTGIMENTSSLFNDGVLLQEQYEHIQNSVKNMSSVELSEGALLKLFSEMMNTIK